MGARALINASFHIEFERTLKNKLMGSLENKMPDVMKNTLPDFTGPSIEIPKKKVNPLGNTQN